MGELGRYPLGVDIVANILMYHKHLQSEKSSCLLKKAVIANKALKRKDSWMLQLDKILDFLSCHSITPNMSWTTIINNLNRLYNKYWKDSLTSQNKLRTYKLFKTELIYENYLSQCNLKYRKSLTRFRISAHRLEIEKGRYSRPPVPASQRLCKSCKDKVEDELHFLIECSKLSESRVELFKTVSNICPNFNSLNENEKFIFLMSAEGETAQFISKFLAKCLP